MHQRRGQHHAEIGDFLGLRDPSHRDRFRGQFVGFLEGQFHVARHGVDQPGPAFGADRPGVDGDEADILGAVLPGERQGQVLAGGVGGAGGYFPVGRLHAVIADQVDHAAAALFDHDRQDIAQAADIAHEFELQRLFPVFLGQRLDHAARRRARIVDHDIDPAKRLGAFLDEFPRLLVVGKIGRDRENLHARRVADFLGRRFQRFRAARADGDIDAFLGQSHGDALADAFAAAGDQGGLSFELQVHCRLLCLWFRCSSSCGGSSRCRRLRRQTGRRARR